MPEELSVRAAYDKRFGTMQLNVDGIIRLKVADLIKALDLPPEEMAALLEDKYQWTEGNADIEAARLRMLCETDCTGKVCLDVGGYDGWAAKRLLDQGAARAICLDNHQYEHYGWEDKKLPGVEYVTGDFMEYAVDSSADLLDEEPRIRRRVGGGVPGAGHAEYLPRPDVVIFYNVLYHLKNPWAALDHLRRTVKSDGQMLLCTLFRYNKQPVLYLYEPLECNPTDQSVFWGPSIEALERLLKFTGWEFKQEGLAYDRVCYRCFPTLEPQFRNSKY